MNSLYVEGQVPAQIITEKQDIACMHLIAFTSVSK